MSGGGGWNLLNGTSDLFWIAAASGSALAVPPLLVPLPLLTRLVPRFLYFCAGFLQVEELVPRELREGVELLEVVDLPHAFVHGARGEDVLREGLGADGRQELQGS